MLLWRRWVVLGVAAVTLYLGLYRLPAGSLWPPVTALIAILLFRQALWGLLAGSLAGAVILAAGNPFSAVVHLLPDHLWPGFTSPWKLGALAFTLILGGFAAILEEGGGFRSLLITISQGAKDPQRRLEGAAAGLGILCFFDGLANSMVVGRVSRKLADKAQVPRVKLAYITDSTSSAVACVAIISTWIAFQLSLIAEAFSQAGRQVNPYAAFLKSLPLNFYCWFTLVMLAVAIGRRFHPGPMGQFYDDTNPTVDTLSERTQNPDGSIASALAPVAILIMAFLGGFVFLGIDGPILPLTRDKLVAAFGSNAGPLVMVIAAGLASLSAVSFLNGSISDRARRGGKAFGAGVIAMLKPVLILMAAWILGSVINALGTADLISKLAQSSGSLPLMPTLVFLTGALVSFATGTSWGTMGLLFPLTIPAAAALGATDHQLYLIVAAVFSGAVFGDHCSPFSDTTIVTSISCGVEPHDHVRTQLPYAFLTAAVAIFFGFLPAGYGIPGWILLPAGGVIIFLLPTFWKTAKKLA